ncbi:MAG: tetratricopeptide repeat protein [Lentisphaeria bacterium]|nr:tetratricopeptide repeat protein [Lentisphaeria bacterium]
MKPVKIFAVTVIGILISMTVAAAPSPWDSWRSGYTNFEQGVSLRERGNYTEALNYFTKARQNYLAVRSARPDWNQRVIADRLRDCDRQISELRRLLDESDTASSSQPQAVQRPATQPPRQPAQRPAAQASQRPAQRPVSQPTARPAVADTGYVTVSRAEREELARLRSEVGRLRTAAQQLESALQKQRNFETEIAALLRDRKAAEDRYALLEQRYKALEAELQRPQDRIAALEQRLVDERMSVERLSNQSAALEQQLRIERENARLSRIAKNSLEEMLRKREEDLRRSNQELSGANEKLQAIAALNEANAALQQQISGRDREISAFRQQLSGKDEQMAALRQQVAEKDGEITVLRQQLTGNTGEISALRQQLAGRGDEITTLQRQLTALRRQKGQLDTNVADLQQQITSLRQQIAVRDEQIADLNRRNNENAAARVDVSAKVSDGEKIAAELRSKVVDLERRVAESNQQAAEADRRAAAAVERASALERRSGELEEKNDILERRAAAAVERASALERRVSESAEQAASAGARVIASASQVSALERQLAELQEQFNSAKTQKTALEMRVSELMREKENIGLTLRETQSQNTDLQSRNRTLQQNVEQSVNSARLSAAEAAGLRERNRSLEEDVRRLHERTEDLERRLALRNSEDFRAAAEARNSVRRLEADLQSAQSELVRLRSELDAGKAALADCERRLKAANDENLRARAEVVAASEREKNLQEQLRGMQQLRSQYDELNRNFQALSAENRQNRSLLEAAKPQQAELERAKLRLLEVDQLRNALAREQQLNSEMQIAYNRDQSELQSLRQRAQEFENARRRLVELEARAKEADRLQELERELTALRAREVELASLKVQYSELQNSFRAMQSANAALTAGRQQLLDEIARLRRDSEDLARLRKVNRELEAMIATNTAELNRLNRQVAAAEMKAQEDVHASCRIEANRLRIAAEAVGPLNDQIQQLQSDLQQMRISLQEERNRTRELDRQIELKHSEIEQLRKLSAELADLQQKSAAELLGRVDASRVTRLEDEITELNKLNAELAAERDRLSAILNNREKSEKDESVNAPRVSNRSPEELVGSGVVAEQNGKTELAIWHYRQALAVKPDFALAHYRLGMIHFRRGSYQEAAAHLDSARNSAPDNLQLALDTARCFIKISRFGNAKSIIDPLLSGNAENAYVQMCAGLVEAGCGAPARAEERLLLAARLAPESAEIQIELARLLANSVSDRLGEAVIAYERARELGAAPQPDLERLLGSMLDHRRELVRFMSGAAREAEMNNDWQSAVWYYRKIMEENNPAFAPLLAFAQWKSGNASAAKEALEFNVPSRNAMVVRALIALAENDNESAMRAAQQSAGALIPVEWIGVNLELERLRKEANPPAAVKILLQSIRPPEASNRPSAGVQ